MVILSALFNLSVCAVQLFYVGKALAVLQESGPVAGGLFLLVAVLFQLAKIRITPRP